MIRKLFYETVVLNETPPEDLTAVHDKIRLPGVGRAAGFAHLANVLGVAGPSKVRAQAHVANSRNQNLGASHAIANRNGIRAVSGIFRTTQRR